MIDTAHSTTRIDAASSELAARVGLSFSDETRAFLEALFAELATALRPERDRSAQEEAAYLRFHLGLGEAQQTRVAGRYPGWAANHVLVALESVLKSAPYQVRELVAFGYAGRRAPTFRAVAVSPSESREVLEDGWYSAVHGELPLAVEVRFVADSEPGLAVSVLVNQEHKELALALLRAVEEYPNFYRGQVITVDEDGNPSFLSVPAVSMDDVILDPTTWHQLRRQVLDFVDMEPAFRAARLPFRRGLLLAGPPGVGKTLAFRALTHTLAGRCTVLWLTSRAIGYPSDIARVFALARSLAPTLVLLEDLDLIVRDRRVGRADLLGELLAQLDGAESSQGVIVCASTNDASALDEALSARPSRFDRVINVGLPSQEARLAMLRRFVADLPRVAADLDWLATHTADMTGADLRELVITAFAEAHSGSDSDENAMGAARPASENASDAARTLETVHFVRALDQLAQANEAARRSGVRRRALGRSGQFGFG
jgi:AAA+ superfamily predicted ATPase